MRRNGILAGVGVAALIAGIGVARAQEMLPTIDVGAGATDSKQKGYGGAGPAQDPNNKSYVLEDASTGTKTRTPVMNTPLNVQTVTQQVLKDQQAFTLEQAVRNVSGVTVATGFSNVSGGRNAGINLRGFEVRTFYRNGFRLDSTGFRHVFTGLNQLADVASVEVMKGPGAMLYGLVEPGGVINIVAKEPLNTPYYSVQQQIGSLALYRTSVDATGPVTSDKSLLYRVNASYENNGAPFGSQIDLTHAQNVFVSPVLKWQAEDDTWVKLEAQYSYDRSSVYWPTDFIYNGSFLGSPRSRNYGEYSPLDQEAVFVGLTWSHQFDKDWSIKQQFAYNNAYESIFFVGPYFSQVSSLVPSGFAVRRTQTNDAAWRTNYSTNIDVVGHFDTFGLRHTLLMGGDGYRTLATAGGNTNLFGSLIDFFNPTHPGVPLATLPAIFFANSFRQDTLGFYLQDQIELPHNFFVLAGARYQYIERENLSGNTISTMQPATSTPLKASAVTPRFGLLWRPQQWVSLFGAYSQGFGPNSGTLYPGVIVPPTNAESWEAGVKFESFDGKARATIDYFELTKTNIPTSDLLHPGYSVVTGEARSKGVEVDVQGEILPGWNVIGTYTNQDVRVTKDNNVAKVGSRFWSVPRNLASLWTTYEFQHDLLRGLKIGGGYTYHGSQPVADRGNAYNAFPLLASYGTVDLMGAYTFTYAEKKITAQLNISNLFDRTYYTDALSFRSASAGLQDWSFRSYGAPFTVQGSLRVEF